LCPVGALVDPAERAVDDPDAVVGVPTAGDGGLEGEPVAQLRAQVALLGVHRPDEGERRGMGEAHAVALDAVVPVGGGVQQHVYEVVVQQVHLVDVEDPAVGSREEAGVELVVAGQRVGHRQRPEDALAGGPERERHQRDGSLRDRRVRPLSTVVTLPVGVTRRTAERAVRDGALGPQQVTQRPDGGRLGGPLLATDQQPAQVVVGRDRE